MTKSILATILRLAALGFLVSASSTIVLARGSAVKVNMIRSIFFTRAAAASKGNNIVLGIKIAKRRGQTLPKFIIVNYNDEKIRLSRGRVASRYVTYTITGQMKKDHQFKPISVPVVNGQTQKQTAIGCSIGIVRCPPGCKSVLFGTDCAVCIVVKCDSSPDFPSVN